MRPINTNSDYLKWRTEKTRLESISFGGRLPSLVVLSVSATILFLGLPGSGSGYAAIPMLISCVTAFIGMLYGDAATGMGARHYSER